MYVQNLSLEKFQGGHIMVTHPFGDHATGSIQQKMLCIYNPQITISPVSSFSVSFNGNYVKNCSKPWTCPLTWAFESKCSCSSCSESQTFLNQCLELSVWVLEFRISLSLHMDSDCTQRQRFKGTNSCNLNIIKVCTYFNPLSLSKGNNRSFCVL